MSRIEEMIRELCPNGVEYKALGDIVEILDSQRRPVAKGKRSAGKYPYYGANGVQDYVEDYIFDGTFLLVGEDGSVINKDKTPVLNWAVGKIWVNNHAHILTEKTHIARLRYIYFVLQTIDISDIVRGVPPKLNQFNLKQILVPVPPLAIQNEIVNILDKFTELEAELEARRKQYEYYRNKLLNFSKFGGGYSEAVKWCKLSDIGAFCGGLTGKSKRDFIAGNAKFITYMNVYSNIAIDLNMNDMVQIAEGEKQNKVEYGDVVFTGSSETPDDCGMSSVMTTRPDGDLYLNSFCFGFRMNDRALLLPDFMKFLFRSEEIRKQIIKTASGVTRFNVSKKRFGEVVIPIPPMKEQQRIVAILDKFETLVNDISEGLPVEIAARRQQYEYYRDKLLTFKRKEDAKIQPCC